MFQENIWKSIKTRHKVNMEKMLSLIAPAVCALCCFPRDLDLMSCPLLSGDRKTLSPLRVQRSIKKEEKGPTAKIKTTKPYTEKPRGPRRLNPMVPNNNF